jgi:hypothetical protein
MSQFTNIQVTRSDFNGNNVEVVTYGYAVTCPAVYVPKPKRKPLTGRQKLAIWRKNINYKLWRYLHDKTAEHGHYCYGDNYYE